MCGIAGILNRKSGSNLRDVIKKMRDSMPYRGPDGEGIFLEQESGIALGHRRLTILDLSAAGRQPMRDNETGLVIVHNGEVYNYLELRAELGSKGYSFHSETDTEVILKAYKEWGIECLQRFNGMFAFAIWDPKNKSLFIARDRLGIKPLYYYQDAGLFLFASEVKAVIQGLGQTPTLNDHLIDQYMSFGYIPGEHTLHKGIERLRPGHYLLLKDNRLQVTEYWDVTFPCCPKDKGLDYYIEHATALLNDSIDLRLRSDVPLGIFLSGGLDSSAVVALLASRVHEPLKTYSVAYNFGPEYNETDYARQVANRFNTDHHEYVVTPNEFLDFIPDYIRYMDEPVTEAAAISLYYIARMARKDVTVVLSGEGSDELFAGYDFYFYNSIIEKTRRTLGRVGTSAICRLLHWLPGPAKVKKYAHLARIDLIERYKGISSYDERIKNVLYTPDFQELTMNHMEESSRFQKNLFKKTEAADPLSRMLYFDTKTWLVDDLLIKADRMSMAPSLELRVPFLDYRLVEFAAQMPSRYKLRGKTTKYILKKMMTGLLPDEIIHRKKMGFPTPLKLMFQNELQEYAQDLLTSVQTQVRHYFIPSQIQCILNEHKKGLRDNHRLIWQLVVLENWLQNNTSSSC